MHTNPMGIIECSFFNVGSARLLASFHHLMVEKHQRSVYLLLLYT